MDLKLEGMEELEKLIQEMTLDNRDLSKAAKNGIEILAKKLEKDSPEKSGRLSKIKTSVKNTGLGVEAAAKAGMFYDVFQEFGTSEQKAHVGYFESSVRKNADNAIKEVAKVVFEKIK